MDSEATTSERSRLQAMADIASSVVSSNFRGLTNPFRRAMQPRDALQRPLRHSVHDTAAPHLGEKHAHLGEKHAGPMGLRRVSLGKSQQLKHSLKPKVGTGLQEHHPAWPALAGHRKNDARTAAACRDPGTMTGAGVSVQSMY